MYFFQYDPKQWEKTVTSNTRISNLENGNLELILNRIGVCLGVCGVGVGYGGWGSVLGVVVVGGGGGMIIGDAMS